MEGDLMRIVLNNNINNDLEVHFRVKQAAVVIYGREPRHAGKAGKAGIQNRLKTLDSGQDRAGMTPGINVGRIPRMRRFTDCSGNNPYTRRT